ncbi:MAG TPA: mechanosensitive ion channel domain-containing protein [Pseudolabrys sp.]|nr:mechanosensitive ion channel domain-containing protein [Pseudolabrys sp.]
MISIHDAISTILDWFAWLPDWAITASVLVLAVIIAFALHRLVRRLVRNLLAKRVPVVASIFGRLRGLTLMALLVLAVFVAIPLTRVDHDSAVVMARVMAIALICLIGWAAIAGFNIAADLYLLRFRIDVEDNLLARKHITQVRVLLRTLDALVILFTIGAALMTFDAVRQYGVSLFASAGVAGIVAGLAARPVLSNLIAGVQIAMTQPIRIDDAVIVEKEFGTIEEITSTYIVVRLWDLRRMVVPLSYFIEKPFQNWTRESSSLIGNVMLYLDYRAPVKALRGKLEEFVKASKHWDGQVVGLQVTDCRENTVELRCLMSARSAGQTFNLRCEVREKLIDFLQREHPEALPRQRSEVAVAGTPGETKAKAEKVRTAAAAAGAR